METRLNTYIIYFIIMVLHRIHVHIYLSGTILNGSFLQNIGDAEHIIVLYADLKESVISEIVFHEHKPIKEEYHRTVGQWCRNRFKMRLI